MAKNDSHMALSYASPTEPIDGCTPSSAQRAPKATDGFRDNHETASEARLLVSARWSPSRRAGSFRARTQTTATGQTSNEVGYARPAAGPPGGLATSFEAATALAFAGGRVAWSRPITGSFAIVAANDTVAGFPIGIKPALGGYAARTDAFGLAVIPNLEAYRVGVIRVEALALPIGSCTTSRISSAPAVQHRSRTPKN